MEEQQPAQSHVLQVQAAPDPEAQADMLELSMLFLSRRWSSSALVACLTFSALTMIKHVKSTRLPICRGLVAFALGCLALIAGAAEIPFEGQRNTIEYKQAGNTYTWSPVTGETPKSGIPYRPDLAKGAVSDTEPKVKWTPRLPYEHKGGDAAKVNIRASVDPAKVAAKAKDAIKSGLSGLATGGGYVALASITCTLLCDAAIEALKGWGIENLDISDGVSVVVPDSDSSSPVSDGYEYRVDHVSALPHGWFYSRSDACGAFASSWSGHYSYYVENGRCVVLYKNAANNNDSFTSIINQRQGLVHPVGIF